jgi:hypothetical protein
MKVIKKLGVFIFLSLTIFSQGRIEYPAFCLFSLEEGTFEAWIKFEFDPKEPTDKLWVPKGGIFSFEIPKDEKDPGAIFSISFGLKNIGKFGKIDSRCYCRVGFSIEGKEIPHPIFVDLTNWEKDTWHHLAVTWFEGNKIKIYVDGKPLEIGPPPDKTVYVCGASFIRDITSNARIIIGTPRIWYYSNNIVIDEIRISSIVREKEDIGYYKIPLIPDEYTLFLENFENIEGDYTKPFLSNLKYEGKYKIEKGKLKEGKIDKGYAFTSN